MKVSTLKPAYTSQMKRGTLQMLAAVSIKTNHRSSTP